MQQEFYVSCIKINGISILPPLMTDIVKQEMNYYKRLAIKTEKKLKARKAINKCAIEYKDIKIITEPMNESKNSNYISDNEVSNNDITSTNNNDSHSRMTIVESTPIMQISTETENECIIQSPTMNTQYPQRHLSLTSGINSLGYITTNINENKHTNETILIMPNENVISSESRKPEVPKTLDIVPITLEDPKYEGANTCPAIISNENENQPKLSRQGSYVLDAPSPILLAHMHTELIDNNYIPTPTINVSQRKQWNIMQSKVEWENNQFIVEDSTMNISNKLEHTDSNIVIDSKYAAAAIIPHIAPDTSIKPYQTNTSISCTQAVVAKEYTCKSDITSSKHINISDTDLERENLLSNSKKDNGTCPLNLINKLQEFTINVSNPEIQLFHKNENKHYDKVEYIKRHQDLTAKAKSSIISEKLLTVYEKIEEMHKKQMTELINRQQREQSLLEEEFQKQRLLLLAEIQKCSFQIPYQINVPNVVPNQRNDEARLEDTINNTNQQWNINSPNSLRSVVHCNSKLPSRNHTNIFVGSLDYISSGNLSLLEHHKVSPFIITDISPRALDLDFTREINLCDAIYNHNNDNNNNNDNNSNYKSHNSAKHKRTIVNRQLFPLDSNTTHIPVLDTSLYLDKHIHAVNIINAYVRGYLVRRLMRTEHVIILKNIYKEALQCMLKLHVDAPLNLAEVNFLHRLQLQCDAASMNIVELFAQCPARKTKIIKRDREIKRSRIERPTSARSYSFATQQTLARKNLKEFESTMTKYQRPLVIKKDIRSRCQTWTSDIREKLMSPNTLRQGIRRSTSAGTVRKPWR